MDHKEWFHLLATMYLWWHALWWSKQGLLNITVKAIFWFLAIWGTVLTLQDFGFIIKP